MKATCPTTIKGTAIVQKGSGVKVNHFYYWNNAFRNPEVIKTAVPVRYDPFDLSTAFALVQNQSAAPLAVSGVVLAAALPALLIGPFAIPFPLEFTSFTPIVIPIF